MESDASVGINQHQSGVKNEILVLKRKLQKDQEERVIPFT